MKPHKNRIGTGRTAAQARSGEERVMGSLKEVASCESCSCELVYPIAWDRGNAGPWRVTLRCPNCEEVRPGMVAEGLIDELDGWLERGVASLVCDLRELTFANMTSEIDAFVEALGLDQILPEDF